MNSVHPGPNAADGKIIEQSHYIKKSDKLDRIIRCAQCGYYVNLQKRSTGPSLGAIGAPTLSSDAVSPPDPGIDYTEYFGDPVDTNSGCPLCNSMNPKGSGRNSDPWTTNSRNVSNF